ncbi:hypothetical protein B1813_13980 [Saccharomonospora piscinae]|uniref:Uncharacterized protein n=1 Tax=Saccharomonospora piscinae TaxID=687388 RepID=A0A1V9A0I0_SACPI|nr:hypothetical protein B1813_13980 [Saccharomonospora piscinae]
METGYRHNGRFRSTPPAAGASAVAATMSVALLALLALPGSAAAQETDPVISGDCPGHSTQGEPLALDSSALGLRVELGESDTGLLRENGPVTGLVGDVCEVGKGTVNGLAEPVQKVLPGKEPATPESSDTPESEIDDDSAGGDSAPIPAPPPAPDTGEHDSPTTPTAPPTPTAHDPAATPGPASAGDGGGPGRVSLDGAALRRTSTPSAPPAADDDRRGSAFTAERHDAGPAHDREALERLPLLLAVIALVLVAAALAHTWARRTLLR